MWQLSIRSKIILVLLLTGLACLAAGAIIGYRAGNAALWQSVKDRLAGHREIKRRRVESYVNNQLLRLRRDLLVAAGVAAIALTFLALVCAGLFMRPLRRVVAGMQAVGRGATASRIKIQGKDEFAELARGYNGMADAIEQRDKRLIEAE
jgi:methyl-accepting chemotaxis protein